MPENRDEPYRRYPFVKVYSRESLEGSLRFENPPEVRSVWWDLLFLANESRNRGMIQANPTTPYPHHWIANKLLIPLDLLELALANFTAQGRITQTRHGILLNNFAYWQGLDTRPRGRPPKHPRQERADLSPEELADRNMQQAWGLQVRDLRRAFMAQHAHEPTPPEEHRIRLQASEATGYGLEEHRFVVRVNELQELFEAKHDRQPNDAEMRAIRRQAAEETGFDPDVGR